MMAAIAASKHGQSDVILLEKNRKTGVKILMSGGTRCNLTHHTDARSITSAFGHADRFLQPAVGAMDPDAVVSMFHQWNVATKVESTGKVFPQSNSAVDVRDALHRAVVESGVEIRLGAGVREITKAAHGENHRWCIATDDGGDGIEAAAVIVTAGGRSWPRCGTSGDAYAWLKKLGHTIVPTRPALVPLVGGLPWMNELSGLTLEDVVVSVHAKGLGRSEEKKLARGNVGDGFAKLPRGMLARRRSSWLWTHFGYSGPAAMDVSGVITAADQMSDLEVRLDLAPEQSVEQIERQLIDSGGKMKLSNVLNRWVPTRLASALVSTDPSATEQDGDSTIAQLSSRRRRSVVSSIKSLALPVSGTRGFAKAEVTAGGVALSQVDRRTMHSRLNPGLFIAGEVLDVDGPIGGYNFQAAFATGRLAGQQAARFVTEEMEASCT